MSASVEAHDMEVNLWVQVDCVVEVEPEAVVELVVVVILEEAEEKI